MTTNDGCRADKRKAREEAALLDALADPDETFGPGTLHDNAPRDYSDYEAHIWTVGYRAALAYVAGRVGA